MSDSTNELLKKNQEQNTKRVAKLKKKNRNRNLWIAGGMVVGAVGGFFIARYFKAKTLGLVLSTVGGSVVVGVPIILATRKKAVARRTEIEKLNTATRLGYALFTIPTATSVVNNAIKTVENVIPSGTTTDSTSTTNQPKTA